MRMNKVIAVSLIALTSACGGTTVSLTQVKQAYNDVDDTFGLTSGTGVSATSDANLPSGSATYSGIATAVGATPGGGTPTFAALGLATASVNFDSGTISGTASDFYEMDDPSLDDVADLTGESISGEITFSLNEINSNQNGYQGTSNGSLTAENGTVHNFGFNITGAAAGTSAQGIAIVGGSTGTGLFSVLAEQD